MSVPAASILVVDDEIQNRKLLELLLQPEGYAVRTAANGEEALAQIARQAPDLVLLDIMMPGMDGYQVAGAIKANPATSSIPIIMITASVGRDARMAGLNAGAEEFLMKPVDRAELYLRVRNLLRLKTLGDFFRNHSAILEREVQARTASLAASELRFRQMAESIRDVFYLRDADGGRMLYVSPAYEEIWGRSSESLYADPKSWSSAIHPEDRQGADDKMRAGMLAGRFEIEYRIERPDGAIRWIESRGFPVRDDAGKVVRIAGVAEDITARKHAETGIKRLNRLYAVLSQINTLIVRVRNRDELFKEACRIAVSPGGFKLAWIAIADRGTATLKPVAWEGSAPDYIERIPLGLDEGDPMFGLAGQAVRDRKPVMVEDMEHDPRVLLRRESRERGFRSLAVLPLVVSGTAVGVLALYATEVGFFNADEMKLLVELAGDIAFAIDHLDKLERLDYLAYYDALTGLANRTLFLERTSQYMRTAARDGHQSALFLIDLERFKNINDSLGQAAGDALLKQVAQWLAHKVGDVNLLARIDADHFAVVLPVVKQEGSVAHLLDKAMDAFEGHPFHLGDGVFRVATKAGVALFPGDGATADALFKNAEAALKKAKAGGDRYLFYAQQMTAAVAGKLTLENQLRQALARGEFVLHFQPLVSLVAGKLTGAEALIRWNDPRTGLVPPGRFIPLLEETGLIYEVGRWALHESIAEHLRWRTAGLPAVRISVNVSPLQLRNHAFVAEIRQAVGVDAGAAAGLQLEITESLLMEDVKHSIATLKAIRAMGVSIAIDDFGTGFSSLSYLSKLPVDALKIDRSFINDMTASPEGLALVSTIIDLAHSLKLKVVAEGVETEEQSRLLRLLDCDQMQGFLFSRPLPSEDFEAAFLSRALAA